MMAELARSWCADEFAAALRLTPGQARWRVDRSLQVTGTYRDVWVAQAAGVINDYTSQICTEELAAVDDPLIAARVRAIVLPKAGGYNSRELRRALRYEIDKADPQAANRRHRSAKKTRNVSIRALDDAMACSARC
ncbi:DUF222 domain-containing protein [Fodinicola acaciae]|uniref:DUF222 domain-containing protein n=1 Tax=Fodinicola acaciae TaxID=2681555 RepID=UPI0013D4497F|nr:DUF222 domain-containing protein [Fodinicola acaciae]